MEKEFIKHLVYMAVGAVSMNKEKLEEFTSKLAEQGKMTEEEGKKIIEDVVQKTKEYREKVEQKIDEVSKSIYDSLHIVSREEVDALKKRIEELEAKLK